MKTTINCNSITPNDATVTINPIKAPEGYNFARITFTNNDKVYTYLTKLQLVEGMALVNFNGEYATVTGIAKSIAVEPWMAKGGRTFSILEEEWQPVNKIRKSSSKEELIKEGISMTNVSKLPRTICAVELRENNGSVVVDYRNPDKEIILADLGVKVFPEKLFIKNFIYLDEQVFDKILRCYVYGAKIGIATPHDGWKVFENVNPKRRYNLVRKDVYTNAIPKKLAIMRSKSGKTFVEALAVSKNPAKFIPTEAWEIMQRYDDKFVKSLAEYNHKVDFDANNTFCKEVYKALKSAGVGVKLGLRNYIEAEGELEFANDMLDVAENVSILSQDQRDFLYANAKYYGVEIPVVRVHTAYKKTAEEGYAQYPERLWTDLSESEKASARYDYRRKGEQAPRDVRNEYLGVQEYEDFAGEAKAYEILMWYILNQGDEALLDDYARCPECGKIYNKSAGICDECGWQSEYSEVSIEGYRTSRAVARRLAEDADEE